MKQISRKDWENYIKALSGLSQKAAQIMQAFAEQNGLEDRDALIRMQYALATKYGEGAASLACQMYDAVAEASGAMVPPAEPAETATYKEAAIAVNGSLKQSPSGKVLPQTTDRLVKQAAADTTLKNALRDGAQFAWVPNGDTCAFCLTLASRGWQYASKKTIQGGHADHIHANCDCTFAIRFDNSTTVAGYDPDLYKRMYYDAGDTQRERLNTMRRIHYAENKDYINAQKRAAYTNRKMNKMASSFEMNDWSGTKPRTVPNSEKDDIIGYAKEKGINIIDLSKFDGSKEMIIEQIDTLSEMMQKYPVGIKKLTLTPTFFSDQGQFGGLANSGRTVFIETQALRDKEATIRNILANSQFAATEPRDIAIHEYGHILARKYGRNGIVFAKKAYYNIFKETPSEKQLLKYLRDNISKQSTLMERRKNGSIVYAEMLPEVLVVHEKHPSAFTKEFLRVLMEGIK